MKKQLYILLAAVSFISTKSSAQNNYNGSSVSGSVSVGDPYLKDFNQSPNTQPTSFNYVREYTPLIPMTSIPDFSSTGNMRIKINTNYKGGWGGSLLLISRNGSAKDVAYPIDVRLSDTTIDYLPYLVNYHSKFQKDAYSKQKNFYNTAYTSEGISAFKKTVSFVDNGKQGSLGYIPGKAFVGQNRGSKTTYSINNNDTIYFLRSSGNNICRFGTYGSGQLRFQKEENQHGQVSLTYKNKYNQVVCKKVYAGGGMGNNGWLSTYYVYNDLGKVIFVVPPMASAQLESNNCLSDIDKLCFGYQYDRFGNVIGKATPGKDDTDRIVYDKLNRPVLTQNAVMKQQGKWAFTVYDALGRVAFAGIYSGAEDYAFWDGIAKGTIAHTTNSNTLEYYIGEPLMNYYNNYPANLNDADIHNYNYYDTYGGYPANSTNFIDTFAAYYITGTGINDPEPYYFSHGKLVASKTKILTTDPMAFPNSSWITTVFFYDEKGRTIQTQTQNPYSLSTWDIITYQYNFVGQKVLDILQHQYKTGSPKTSTKALTRYYYGTNTGWLEHVEQKLDNDAWHAVVSYTYDEFGKQKSRKLGGNAEVQNFTYKIAGDLEGINASELWNTGTSTDSMHFWELISYEKGFSQPRYDGLKSGFTWRTSSSAVSAYGYQYDNRGNMIAADYQDYSQVGSSPASWNNTNRDFSVSSISFDANGNMQSMTQRGYDANMDPADIDVLSYSYDAGNKLLKVTDAGVSSPIHDFDNGTTATNDDYTYDANGNLASDANKQIDNITYNHQDLPLSVTKGPESISNIYDAGGTLLKKIINENGQQNVYNYWGSFVYRNDSLLYLLNDGGRVRWLADSGCYKYDYFIKDHIGNVRAVVTSDVTYDTIGYHAGYELVAATQEEFLFDNIGPIRDMSPTSVPGDEFSGWLDGCDAAKRIGSALLVHAMAGDQFNIKGYGYYEDTSTANMNTYSIPSQMLNALSGVMLGGVVPGGEGVNNAQIVNDVLSTTNYDLYDALKQSVTDPSFPRAYLNYLVFDEEFKLNTDASKVIQLSGAANAWNILEWPGNFTMPANGYMLCYFSNESCVEVAVDNMYAIHYKGRLLEEQHYYPHGLVVEMGGQTTTPLVNKYLHQGKLMQDELGLQLYDFHARQYDPQIGRFWGLDPADQYPSGYTGMGNDPANMIDPSGMVARIGDGQFLTKGIEFNQREMKKWNPEWAQGGTGVDKSVIQDNNFSDSQVQPIDLMEFNMLFIAKQLNPYTTQKQVDAQSALETSEHEDPNHGAIETVDGTYLTPDGNVLTGVAMEQWRADQAEKKKVQTSGNAMLAGSNTKESDNTMSVEDMALQSGGNTPAPNIEGSLKKLDQGLQNTALERALTSHVAAVLGPGLESIGTGGPNIINETMDEMKGLKIAGKFMKAVGDVFGVVSLIDHGNSAFNAFRKEGVTSVDGWLNVGKAGVDIILMTPVLRGAKIGVSVGYGIFDMATSKW